MRLSVLFGKVRQVAVLSFLKNSIFLFLLTSCSAFMSSYSYDSVTSSSSSSSFSGKSLILTSSRSPSKSNEPTFQVRDFRIEVGDKVRLFHSSACTVGTEASAEFVANEQRVDLNTIASPNPITTQNVNYDFYYQITKLSSGVSFCESSQVIHYVWDNTLPPEPSIALSFSQAGASTDSKPLFTVTYGLGNFAYNDLIRIYQGDSTCTNTSQIVATAVSLGAQPQEDVRLSTALTDPGIYYFYVQVEDEAGNISACSQIAADYEFDPTPPNLSLLTSDGANPNPVIRISGDSVKSGADVQLFSDAACSSPMSLNSSVTSTYKDLDSYTLLTSGAYDYFARVTFNGLSSCSFVKVTYNFDNTPPTESEILYSGNSSSAQDTDSTPTFTIRPLSGNFANGTLVKIYKDACGAGGTLLETKLLVTGASASTDITLSSPISDFGVINYYVSVEDSFGNLQCSSMPFSYSYIPRAPSSVSRSSPASLLGHEPHPTFTVSGADFRNGASVQLYTDSGCAVTSGSAANATGASASVQGDVTGMNGSYQFFATVSINGVTSACSTNYGVYDYDGMAPSSPTVSVSSSSSSPYTDTTPTFTISSGDGNFSGEMLKLFEGGNNTCNGVLRGSVDTSLLSNPSSVDITTNAALTALGDHYFYVSVSDAAGNMTCDSGTLYTLVPPAPLHVSLKTPASSPGGSAHPVFTVQGGGVVSGSSVKLYSDQYCTAGNELSLATTAAASSVDVTVNATLTNATIYDIYATVSISGFESPCSTAHASYEYNSDSIIYLADVSAGCNDSGPGAGTYSQPFCSAQGVAKFIVDHPGQVTVVDVGDAGAGDFGTINLQQLAPGSREFGSGIVWRGLGYSKSKIGVVNGMGEDGSSGIDSGSDTVSDGTCDAFVPTEGVDGSSAYQINLKSNGTVSFGNILASGGNGGKGGDGNMSSADCLYNGKKGGNGGSAASVQIDNAKVGAVVVTGGIPGDWGASALDESGPSPGGSADVYFKNGAIGASVDTSGKSCPKNYSSICTGAPYGGANIHFENNSFVTGVCRTAAGALGGASAPWGASYFVMGGMIFTDRDPNSGSSCGGGLDRNGFTYGNAISDVADGYYDGKYCNSSVPLTSSWTAYAPWGNAAWVEIYGGSGFYSFASTADGTLRTYDDHPDGYGDAYTYRAEWSDAGLGYGYKEISVYDPQCNKSLTFDDGNKTH